MQRVEYARDSTWISPDHTVGIGSFGHSFKGAKDVNSWRCKAQTNHIDHIV